MSLNIKLVIVSLLIGTILGVVTTIRSLDKVKAPVPISVAAFLLSIIIALYFSGAYLILFLIYWKSL